MTGPITWEMVAAFLVVLGALSGAWWRIETRIEAARRDAATAVAAASAQAHIAQQQLAEFRIHVAETYASKGGVREGYDRLAAAVQHVAEEITRLHERMDRIIESREGRRPP